MNRLFRSFVELVTCVALPLLAGDLAAQATGEDVRYPSGDITLAATLYLPDGPGPHPAAVIVQGSGDSGRSNQWSRDIADVLVGHGLAVLHTDKRGSGESGGDWRTSGFDDLASDALAGVAFLRSRREIDPDRVGLAGLSQGGWIVPLAAAREPIAFVIDISGATVSYAEQSFHEMAATTRQAGFDEEAVAGVLDLNRAAGAYLIDGDWERYRAARARGMEAAWGEIAAGFPGEEDAPIWSFLRRVFLFDPIPYWLEVEAPVFVVFGSEDERDNVPVAESVHRLEFAFGLIGKENYEIQVVPGVGHGIRLEEHPHPLAPQFAEALGRWLEQHVHRSSVGSGEAERPDSETVRAIVGGNVIPMDRPGLLERQTILVRNDRIEAVGPADSIRFDPAEVEQIDASGRYVMPGLIDAHVHLRESGEDALIRYLRAGITTVRDMNGRPWLLEWRDRIARGELPGPTMYVAAPTLGNFSSPREGYPTPETTEQGRAAVRRFHEAGYDWIKVYSFLPTDAFHGVLEEAARVGMPVGGHVPVSVGSGIFESGLRSIEHLSEYADFALEDRDRSAAEADLRTVFHAGRLSESKLEAVARRTAAAGIWNVPSLVWFDRNLPVERALSAWRQLGLRTQGRANRRAILGALHRTGAPIAVGTDSDGLAEKLPPAVILEEMRAMTEAGMTEVEVLEAATVHGARLLGGLEEFGTIAPGKRADLLVLYCDPRRDLDCLAQPEWVMARGRLPVHEIDRKRVARQRAGTSP